jgi:hypothetical protein
MPGRAEIHTKRGICGDSRRFLLAFHRMLDHAIFVFGKRIGFRSFGSTLFHFPKESIDSKIPFSFFGVTMACSRGLNDKELKCLVSGSTIDPMSFHRLLKRGSSSFFRRSHTEVLLSLHSLRTFVYSRVVDKPLSDIEKTRYLSRRVENYHHCQVFCRIIINY